MYLWSRQKQGKRLGGSWMCYLKQQICKTIFLFEFFGPDWRLTMRQQQNPRYHAATESKISLKKPPLVKIMAQLETLKTPKIQCWFLFFLSNKLHLGGFLPTYKRLCAWMYQIHKFSAHLCCRFQTARGQTSLTCTCSTKSLFLTVKCC